MCICSVCVNVKSVQCEKDEKRTGILFCVESAI